MSFEIRKLLTIVEEVRIEEGREAPRPLKRVATLAVVRNPYAGGAYCEDLGEAVRWSAELGALLGARAVAALGGDAVEGYGKGAIAGEDGAQEHANAFLTSSFGDAFRATVGGARAWIPSATKVGTVGTPLDVPTAYKDALWVRSHYDAMELRVPDAPRRDEVVVGVVVTSGGRLNARLGGLAKADVRGEDGLR
jgi:hypothetical protein